MSAPAPEVYRAEFVEFMPRTKEPGILYVSDRFSLAVHLCACGCGVQTVMPLQGGANAHIDGWTMTRDGDALTFAPSILNQSCGSHYFIEQNRVRWA